MLRVEEEGDEYVVFETGELRAQVVTDDLWRRHCAFTPNAPTDDVPRGLKNFVSRGGTICTRCVADEEFGDGVGVLDVRHDLLRSCSGGIARGRNGTPQRKQSQGQDGRRTQAVV
jgi:hypothetical protein